MSFDSYFDLRQAYIKDRVVVANLFLAIFLNLIIWVGLLAQSRDFSEQVPLHYNIYFGIDYFGPRFQLLLLPGIGLLLYAVNAVLSFALFSRYRLLSYFLLGTATFSQAVLAWAAALIVYIAT